MSEACSGQLQAHYCETCGSQVREIGGDLGFCKTTVSFLQLTGTELCFKGRKCLLLQLLHQPSFLVLSILYPAISPRQTSKGQKEKKKNNKQKHTTTKAQQQQKTKITPNQNPPGNYPEFAKLNSSLWHPLPQFPSASDSAKATSLVFSEINLFLMSLQELPKMVIIINNEIWICGESKLLQLALP